MVKSLKIHENEILLSVYLNAVAIKHIFISFQETDTQRFLSPLLISKHSGISRDKTMADDDKQNYPFCILQVVVETFGHST